MQDIEDKERYINTGRLIHILSNQMKRRNASEAVGDDGLPERPGCPPRPESPVPGRIFGRHADSRPCAYPIRRETRSENGCRRDEFFLMRFLKSTRSG